MKTVATMTPHLLKVKIYYEDTDAGGVVYHASYLRFAERARTEALRDLGIPHAEMVERYTLMFMVRRCEIDYVRPARVDESLTVVTEALAVRGASVLLQQDIQGAHGTCAVARVRLACVRVGGNKPGRIPDRWRETLQALCAARGAAGAAPA
jgi:acyl-CoA thioester hydrolase